MLRPGGHLFYGWYIVGAAAGIQLFSGLLWMQSYGAYVVVLQDEFGWSKTLLAGAFAFTRIESGILGPLQGWLADKYGPRATLRVGIVLFGIGFMLFSQIETLLGFYLTFALIAVGSSLGGFATVMVALVNWFHRHRSKAVATSQLGFSLGGLAVPLVVLCLEALGWRATAFLSGAAVLVLGLPLVQVVRHRPQDYGEVMDGGSLSMSDNPRPDENRLSGHQDFTARQAMRTSSFWLISLGHGCALLSVSAVIVHLVPHLIEDLHYTLAQAGLVVALMTGFQMCGQVCGGFLGDRLNKRLICVICMFAHAIGLLLLGYTSSYTSGSFIEASAGSPATLMPGPASEPSSTITFLMVLLFAVLHGLGWGIRGPLMVALRADYFGPSSFGTIMGFSSLIVMLGMSAGPIFAGFLADTYGNYELGFTVLGISALAGSVCFMFARPPQRPGLL